MAISFLQDLSLHVTAVLILLVGSLAIQYPPSLLLGIFILVCILAGLYILFWPLNRIKELCDTGYGQQMKDDVYGQTKRELVNEIRRYRKHGDIPPIYPNGWFAILESECLQPGQVKSVHVLGENLVVFRTKEGEARVVDAYCPHLGAHLGIGGRVVGDNIECPFHGWQFRGQDGQCTVIPYAAKVPSFARINCWPVEEANGFIFLWYHAEKEKPSWHVPVIPEIQSKKWIYRGRTDYQVNAHIQEIPENGADVAHLGHLHSPSMMFGSDLRTTSKYGAVNNMKESKSFFSQWNLATLLRHHWHAEWNPEPEPNGHIGISKLHHDFRLLGKWPFIVMKVEARQIGPAIVHLAIETSLGQCILIQTVTPVEPLLQRVIHRMYTAPTVIAPYAKLILWGEAIMFERDVMIWNHKTYIGRPLLVSEDRTITKHRRWFQQFYSEHSPRLIFQKDSLDW